MLLTLNIVFDEVDRGLRHGMKKKNLLLTIDIVFSKNDLRINTVQKKMFKADDCSSHQNNIKVLHFYCEQRSRFIFRRSTLKKSLKRFITEYITDVRTIISQT